MGRIFTSIFLAWILVLTASACATAEQHVVLVPQQVPEVDLTTPLYELPAPRGSVIGRVASLLTDGVTATAHVTVNVAADLPVHASHLPELTLGTCRKGGDAAGHGAIKAKAAAQEGVHGFSAFTSILLRIASSSFSALVSGILRF